MREKITYERSYHVRSDDTNGSFVPSVATVCDTLDDVCVAVRKALHDRPMRGLIITAQDRPFVAGSPGCLH